MIVVHPPSVEVAVGLHARSMKPRHTTTNSNKDEKDDPLQILDIE